MTALLILACGGAGGVENENSDRPTSDLLHLHGISSGGSRKDYQMRIPNKTDKEEITVKGGEIALGPARTTSVENNATAVIVQNETTGQYSFADYRNTAGEWVIENAVPLPVPVTDTILNFSIDRTGPGKDDYGAVFQVYSSGVSRIHLWNRKTGALVVIPGSEGGQTPTLTFDESFEAKTGKVVWTTGTVLKESSINNFTPSAAKDLNSPPVEGWSPVFRNRLLYYLGLNERGKTAIWYGGSGDTRTEVKEVPDGSRILRLGSMSYAVYYSPDEYGAEQQIRLLPKFVRPPTGEDEFTAYEVPKTSTYQFLGDFNF